MFTIILVNVRLLHLGGCLMSDTKNRILDVSLKLFAKKGFDAVSVSEIAGELGITKGALYKHYKNKRDIYDSIVKKMYQTDKERSSDYDVPDSKYESDPNSYENISVDNIKKFTVAQFYFWTKDDFASDFLKMITIEQYNDPEMAKLYDDCICRGPVSYMEDIFSVMMEKEILKNNDSKLLALEFYAPMYLMIGMNNHYDDKSKLIEILENHIDTFFENNLLTERKKDNEIC